MRYEFQRSRVDPHLSVELTDAGVELTLDDTPRRVVPYGDIATVRLRIAPEHGEVPAHYVCALELRAGETLSFDSIAYDSATDDFKSTDYRSFVGALHAKLLTGNHRVRYMAGNKTRDIFGDVAIAFVVLFVGGTMVVTVLDKAWWVILSAVVGAGSLLWTLIKGVRRHRNRPYEPRAIPEDLMPEAP